jgi:hypothetical protein
VPPASGAGFFFPASGVQKSLSLGLWRRDRAFHLAAPIGCGFVSDAAMLAD